MSRSGAARKKSPVSAKRVSARVTDRLAANRASQSSPRNSSQRNSSLRNSSLRRTRANIQPVVSNSEEMLLQTAREHVQVAAQILKSLDPERARVGWLLEEAIVYLDDIEVDEIIEPYQPIQELEPLLNAFAHLVAVHEDRETLAIFHPTGGDVLRADLRAGPQLSFKVFWPKAGVVRLFCIVSIQGKVYSVPFQLTVTKPQP